MSKQEKLYETLGELLYAVAMADGVIQSEESDAMKSLLKNHPWATTISWSFDYEVAKENKVEDVYKKAVSYCHSYGPTPEYEEFISAMEMIANAHEGTSNEEAEIVTGFSRDLIARFRRDLGIK
ncbi:hypothetical protein [Sanyastnella coralliicola]|uniref:hypothetical protein n=1 Tax=Sanyastnella coralliicola TaxID=3069118 RepID=UPI0027B90672|nr:hypothetical protein [Longitalea sp. SCSIO 12813]